MGVFSEPRLKGFSRVLVPLEGDGLWDALQISLAFPALPTDGAVFEAMLSRMWRRLPAFFLIGLLLFAADRLLLQEPAAAYVPPPVRISPERVEELRRSLWLRGGAEPSAVEIDAMVDAEVADELLYREALALGFDRDDPVIFNRLVMNMRFAGEGDERDAGDLYREARDLGMHLTDIVVRRRLIQRMRLLIESSAEHPEPTLEELRSYFEARSAELIRPARVRFVHRYFSREHEEEAIRALETLRGAGPDAGGELADAFLLPPEQPPQSQRELAGRFGADFAAGVFEVEAGAWAGLVPSAYGQHLVYVVERSEAEPLRFEEVRDKMRYGLLAQRGEAALAEAIERLREGVEVQVEPPTS